MLTQDKIQAEIDELRAAKKKLFNDFIQSGYENTYAYKMFLIVCRVLDRMLDKYPQYFPYQPHLV